MNEIKEVQADRGREGPAGGAMNPFKFDKSVEALYALIFAICILAALLLLTA